MREALNQPGKCANCALPHAKVSQEYRLVAQLKRQNPVRLSEYVLNAILLFTIINNKGVEMCVAYILYCYIDSSIDDIVVGEIRALLLTA